MTCDDVYTEERKEDDGRGYFFDGNPGWKGFPGAITATTVVIILIHAIATQLL